MEKIRILAVIDHLGKGGAERQFLNLINNLDIGRFEPHIFIAERAGERFSELCPHIQTHGLLRSHKRKTFNAIKLLRETIIDIKPSIIQTWLDYSTFVTAIALKTISVKTIFVASHRTSIEELYNTEVKFGRIKKTLLIRAYRQAQRVTTNSKILVEQLNHYGITKNKLIYNGIDLKNYKNLPSRDELRKKLGLPTDTFYISFVGALVERKGIRYFIKAIKNTNKNNMKALIIGDGELRDTVNTITKEDSRFVLLGFQPNAIEYIKASDLLVLPSLYEGLPNVVIEAMAVGTPVIATNVYGMPELIEDGINGTLVSVKDSKSITSAIEFIEGNPAVAARFVESSGRKAEFFNVDRMVKEYETLYSELYEDNL